MDLFPAQKTLGLWALRYKMATLWYMLGFTVLYGTYEVMWIHTITLFISLGIYEFVNIANMNH